MKSRKRVVILGFLLISFIIGGCAPIFISAKVNYDLQTVFTPIIPKAEKVNLYVEKFFDVRGGIEPNVIGEARTGMFDERTPILIEDNIEELSTRTLQKAFSKAGFNVVLDEKDADLVFKGRINNFKVQDVDCGLHNEYSEANVEFDVVLIDRVHGKNLWFDVKRSYLKSRLYTDTLLPNEEALMNEKILNEVFNKVINSIVKDFYLYIAINDFIKSKK